MLFVFEIVSISDLALSGVKRLKVEYLCELIKAILNPVNVG